MPFDFRIHNLGRYSAAPAAILIGTSDMEESDALALGDAFKSFETLGFMRMRVLLPSGVSLEPEPSPPEHRMRNTREGIESAVHDVLSGQDLSSSTLAFCIAGHGGRFGGEYMFASDDGEINGISLAKMVPEGIDTTLITSQCYGRGLGFSFAFARTAPTTVMSISNSRTSTAYVPARYAGGFLEMFWREMRTGQGDLYLATNKGAAHDCYRGQNEPMLTRFQEGRIIDKAKFPTRFA